MSHNSHTPCWLNSEVSWCFLRLPEPVQASQTFPSFLNSTLSTSVFPKHFGSSFLLLHLSIQPCSCCYNCILLFPNCLTVLKSYTASRVLFNFHLTSSVQLMSPSSFWLHYSIKVSLHSPVPSVVWISNSSCLSCLTVQFRCTSHYLRLYLALP